MIVHITLYGLLRERLPRAARGKADLDLPEGATLAVLLSQLGIGPDVRCAVNGIVERDMQRTLKHDDELKLFRAAGGG